MRSRNFIEKPISQLRIREKKVCVRVKCDNTVAFSDLLDRKSRCRELYYFTIGGECMWLMARKKRLSMIIQLCKNRDLEITELINEIIFWEKETKRYRWLNILLYFAMKTLVPILSSLTAILISPAVAQDNSLLFTIKSQHIKLYIMACGIGATVLSAIDTYFAPGNKKKLAFIVHAELLNLRHSLIVDYYSAEDKNLETKKHIIQIAQKQLRTVLRKIHV